MGRVWLATLTAATLAAVGRADGPVWVQPTSTTVPAWKPSTVQPPLDLPKPPSKPLPVPKPLPPVPETAPQPQPVEPPQPLPKPVEPPPAAPSQPLPTPRPTDPQPPPAATLAPPIEQQQCLEPPPDGYPPAATLLPARRGVVGSPNLTLSRDGNFLDLFGAGILADEGTTILGEPRSVDRFFVSAEYLLWWVRPAAVPVLATTASGQSMGFLGESGTQALIGPGSFGDSRRDGFRVRAGAWFDAGGLDASYFFLGKQTTSRTLDSSQYPTIARPFFAPNLNREFAELVAYPGLSAGRLVVDTSSELWGADVNVRGNLYCGCDRRAELFAGYRYLNLRESLSVTELITVNGSLAPDPIGTSVLVNDTFRTRNQFNGGQVGWAANRRVGRLDLSARVSVALGATSQQLSITGSQLRIRPGQTPETFNGGLLAVGPNLGDFSRTRFSVVPEATLNVGVWVTPGLKAFVGYNFLYWSNVLRPGDQIDRTVDLSNIPNFSTVGAVTNRPLPTFRQADVWAQGIQFGVEWRW